MNPIKLLLHDIKQLGWRGVIVAGLSVLYVPPLLDPIGIPWFDQYSWVYHILYFVLISIIISTAPAKNLKLSRAASYTAVITVAIWLTALLLALASTAHIFKINTLGNPDGSITGAYLFIGPLFLITVVAIITIASGLMSYYAGKKRKDIKGIRKEDLFK